MIQAEERTWQRAGAFAVHAYTASGAFLGFLIVMAAIQGNVVMALWIGLVAMFVDGTDGMLARRMRVRERLPWFDGGRLDDIVDYLTYVFAPVVLLWNCGYLPQGWSGILFAALPLFASTYQFCRVDAKTEDHFFLGFPSYWNVVAFYAIVQGWSTNFTAGMLIFCTILVFIPIRYLYPSRTVAFRRVTMAVSGIWMLSYIVLLLEMPTPNLFTMVVSLACVVYYVAASLYLNFRTPAPRPSWQQEQ